MRFQIFLLQKNLKPRGRATLCHAVVHKLFFSDQFLALYRANLKKQSPPPPKIIPCPVCGKNHNALLDFCPQCGFAKSERSNKTALAEAKLVYALPADKKISYEAEIAEAYLQWRAEIKTGGLFGASTSKIESVKRKYRVFVQDDTNAPSE